MKADKITGDVDIAGPSARDELITVVRAGMAITAAVWIYLANDPFPATGGGALQRTLLPYQRAVRDLPSGQQRMFRELQVSLIEAETLRSTAGAWPDPGRLAADGIEPFAPNPTARESYEWRLIANGFLINYLGIPKEPGSAAWLLLVQEPDPAAPPEVFQEDEDHDRLADGTVLHVSIWNHPDGARVPARFVAVPHAEGWMQLYAADPAATR